MAFEKEVRALEEVLLKEMRAKAKQAHGDNPNKVFQDIKTQKVQPVQMLKDQVTAQIATVEPEDQAFTYEDPAKFDPTKPIQTPCGPMQPIVVTEDKVWVEQLPAIEPGMMATQDIHVRDLTTLFDRFNQEWSARAKTP